MKLRVKIDAEIFEVEITNLSARPVRATVDGETFEIWPEEDGGAPAVLPAAPAVVSSPVGGQAAAAPSSADKTRAVLAPIPGVILSISAQPGDVVVMGQELCVLEAMKMKNSIRAGRAGTIAAVRVSPGDQVRHGQVLMDYAD